MQRAGGGWVLATVAATVGLYLAALAAGAWMGGHRWGWDEVPGLRRVQAWGMGEAPAAQSWRMASVQELAADRRAQVERGAQLFDETPVYLAGSVQARLACASCHIAGGTSPLGLAVVGSAESFPQFSRRAGRRITLADRVQECMVRSENGRPLGADGAEMRALLAYIHWLSEPHPGERRFQGRGLEKLPALTPDPVRGAEVYAAQCAGCHGEDGQGTRRPFPPLWGERSFNDGAGMDGVAKLAAFIHTNMPQNRKGILTAQQAWDVAAYVQQQPRPAFDRRYAHL